MWEKTSASTHYYLWVHTWLHPFPVLCILYGHQREEITLILSASALSLSLSLRVLRRTACPCSESDCERICLNVSFYCSEMGAMGVVRARVRKHPSKCLMEKYTPIVSVCDQIHPAITTQNQTLCIASFSLLFPCYHYYPLWQLSLRLPIWNLYTNMVNPFCNQPHSS